MCLFLIFASFFALYIVPKVVSYIKRIRNVYGSSVCKTFSVDIKDNVIVIESYYDFDFFDMEDDYEKLDSCFWSRN